MAEKETKEPSLGMLKKGSVMRLTEDKDGNELGVEVGVEPKKYPRYGIVGHFNCGKSNCLRSITKVIKPDKGAIYIDGKDISNIPLQKLRDHITVIT